MAHFDLPFPPNRRGGSPLTRAYCFSGFYSTNSKTVRLFICVKEKLKPTMGKQRRNRRKPHKENPTGLSSIKDCEDSSEDLNEEDEDTAFQRAYDQVGFIFSFYLSIGRVKRKTQFLFFCQNIVYLFSITRILGCLRQSQYKSCILRLAFEVMFFFFPIYFNRRFDR